jgi:hypothetical protein
MADHVCIAMRLNRKSWREMRPHISLHRAVRRPHIVLELLAGRAALQEPENDGDQGHDEQNVNESSEEAQEESDCPQNDQDDDDGFDEAQHCCPSLAQPGLKCEGEAWGARVRAGLEAGAQE